MIVRNESANPGSVAWSSFVAFQRKKPAAIGVKAPSPGFIEPALATTIERVPGGQRWVHEIKFDRYRAPVISETPQSRFEPL
jgi:bifunctional non-homologous end joining protein LigD